jgi:Protein of unknown function (DUF1573)
MKMKGTLTLLALLLGMFSIITHDQAVKASPPAPKLVIAAPEYSFGNVKPGTPLTHTFKFRKEGQADLEIKNVKPGCGCTAANFDKVVSPGKEGGITLKIEDTTGYKGEVWKTADVTTNDPERPTFKLTLRANFTTE